MTEKIANKFKVAIVTKTDANIVKTKSQFHESLKNPNEKTFFLAPTIAEELEDHLKFLSDRKAIGTNGFPTKILKTFKKVLSQPLTELFDLICSTGSFPDACKIAKVIPLHKKDSNLECNNYRPVSLCQTLGK